MKNTKKPQNKEKMNADSKNVMEIISKKNSTSKILIKKKLASEYKQAQMKACHQIIAYENTETYTHNLSIVFCFP